MVELTDKPIDLQQVLRDVQAAQCGAVVLFVGTTRQFTGGRESLSLDYECYEPMALGKLKELESEALRRWDLQRLCVVHRLGHVAVAEASVAVAVSSAHRAAAFEAGQWLIDTIKQVVPIWKKENWADGTSDWVHPGVDGSI